MTHICLLTRDAILLVIESAPSLEEELTLTQVMTQRSSYIYYTLVSGCNCLVVGWVGLHANSHFRTAFYRHTQLRTIRPTDSNDNAKPANVKPSGSFNSVPRLQCSFHSHCREFSADRRQLRRDEGDTSPIHVGYTCGVYLYTQRVYPFGLPSTQQVYWEIPNIYPLFFFCAGKVHRSDEL